MMSIVMDPYEQAAHTIIGAMIRLNRRLPDAAQVAAVAAAIFDSHSTPDQRRRLTTAFNAELAARTVELPWRE